MKFTRRTGWRCDAKRRMLMFDGPGVYPPGASPREMENNARRATRESFRTEANMIMRVCCDGYVLYEEFKKVYDEKIEKVLDILVSRKL